MHLPVAPTGTELSDLCGDLTALNWALPAPCHICYAELNRDGKPLTAAKSQTFPLFWGFGPERLLRGIC